MPEEVVASPPEPVLTESSGSGWEEEADEEDLIARTRSELEQTVARLREQHLHNRDFYEERMARLRRVREEAARSRTRISRDALSRRRVPSS